MRVSWVTAPPLTGTLKSPRTSTRLPAQSRCWTVFFANVTGAPSGRMASSSGELEQRVDDAVRETPLVVVPRQDLHQVTLHNVRGQGIDDAARRIADDVVRHDRVVAKLEDAAERALGRGLERGIPLVARDLPLHLADQVHERAVHDRHAYREPVEASFHAREHLADRLGRAGRRGDHAPPGRAGASRVLV